MATPTTDPKPSKNQPHATTQDQINEMESEGQAQAQADSTLSEADQVTDQDIDTAGTEADPAKAPFSKKAVPGDPLVETPGDTDAADIVGPTGEQMPVQRHAGAKRGSHRVRH